MHDKSIAPLPVGRFLVGLAVLWTAIVGVSLAWNLVGEEREKRRIARVYAATAFEKDVAYRQWMSRHGGVYVWTDEQTQPSELLSEIPGRDVHTPDGMLTLVNPATILRLVYELEREQSGLRSHITSLTPLRAENAPDDWETEALRSFERGQTEVSSIDSIDGKPYMRLMRPLITDAHCLKCHRKQGYQVGDVRGGISISVPLEPISAVAWQHMFSNLVGHGLLWVMGLAGMLFQGTKLGRQIRKRRQAEDELRESETQRRILAEKNARFQAEQVLGESRRKLRLAAEIQKGLLPDKEPALPGCELSALLCPAEATGGDFYDFLEMPDGSLGIVLADVSGHGIDSAMIAAATSACLRTLVAECSAVDQLLTRLNDYLVTHIPDDYFVTLFLARFDARSRSFSYASAAHQAYLADGVGTIKVLDATSPPLGVAKGLSVSTAVETGLEPGQAVVFLTDGFHEAANPHGERFGNARIMEMLRSHHRKSSREIAETLYDAARGFAESTPQSDDMTAVVLKVDPAG